MARFKKQFLPIHNFFCISKCLLTFRSFGMLCYFFHCWMEVKMDGGRGIFLVGIFVEWVSKFCVQCHNFYLLPLVFLQPCKRQSSHSRRLNLRLTHWRNFALSFRAYFLKYWPLSTSFCLFLVPFKALFNYKLKKRRCSGWESNPGPQDGRQGTDGSTEPHSFVNSVTRKKSTNVYKSCPKMISLEKW